MATPINSVVILGGGTAGWLTAGLIAAKHQSQLALGLKVTLVESPDIKTVGVGEGTWPTMRNTLRTLGVSEQEFITQCNATFKQGTRFNQWVSGKSTDYFYQPFSLPQGYYQTSIVPFWQSHNANVPYASAVNHQPMLCEKYLAPKRISTPQYADIVNYGYHLDAGMFASFIQQHCTQKLGVNHVLDTVVKVNAQNNGDIKSLSTVVNGDIEGQLFIDCSGFSSMLLGKHFEVPFVDKQDVLFIDKAIAAHLPYEDKLQDIASTTISTAQSAGWIWDIGLQTRQGIGHVYSSQFISDDEATQTLLKYARSKGANPAELSLKTIDIRAGYRQTFWQKNCVAIGLSAGFLEPLEASALALVEYAANIVSQRLPATTRAMLYEAKHFNEQMHYHWQQIINFLKLHYVLSQRKEPFWQANRDPAHIPESLQQNLSMWKERVPQHNEFSHAEEVFPAAGYQYVLYGMGFRSEFPRRYEIDHSYQQYAAQLMKDNHRLALKYAESLPNHRDLINDIYRHGLSTL